MTTEKTIEMLKKLKSETTDPEKLREFSQKIEALERNKDILKNNPT